MSDTTIEQMTVSGTTAKKIMVGLNTYYYASS